MKSLLGGASGLAHLAALGLDLYRRTRAERPEKPRLDQDVAQLKMRLEYAERQLVDARHAAHVDEEKTFAMWRTLKKEREDLVKERDQLRAELAESRRTIDRVTGEGCREIAGAYDDRDAALRELAESRRAFGELSQQMADGGTIGDRFMRAAQESLEETETLQRDVADLGQLANETAARLVNEQWRADFATALGEQAWRDGEEARLDLAAEQRHTKGLEITVGNFVDSIFAAWDEIRRVRTRLRAWKYLAKRARLEALHFGWQAIDATEELTWTEALGTQAWIDGEQVRAVLRDVRGHINTDDTRWGYAGPSHPATFTKAFVARIDAALKGGG